MFWVTWRQSRTELLIGGVALALVTAFLLWTGFDLRSDYKSLGIGECIAESERSNICSEAMSTFSSRMESVRDLAMWLIFVPLLIGVLLAAPVILDLEQGTFRLAWTQGVPRLRWLATKVVLALIIAALGSVALMTLWRWWDSPFSLQEYSRNQFDTGLFDNEGIVVVAYTIFAFALCLAVGTIFRRSVPAFGIALVGFVAIRIGISERLRPNYLEPLKSIGDPIVGPENQIENGAWILKNGLSDQFGHMWSWSDPALQACFGAVDPGPNTDKPGVSSDVAGQLRCFQDNDIYMTTIYHPADRYWTFQAIETAIFLGMAAILLAITFYWITRRIAR